MASSRVRSRANLERTREQERENDGEKPVNRRVESANTAKRRASSNVFSMLSQSMIQELKETFTMIDQNRDGFIDIDDLLGVNRAIGREPKTSELDEMIKEAPGPLNFTMFLTLFGEKTHGTDPEETLKSAFALFDESNNGFLDEEYFKDLLLNTGDIFSKDELKQTLKEAPITKGQGLDYMKLAQIIKRGKEEDLQT